MSERGQPPARLPQMVCRFEIIAVRQRFVRNVRRWEVLSSQTWSTPGYHEGVAKNPTRKAPANTPIRRGLPRPEVQGLRHSLVNSEPQY